MWSLILILEFDFNGLELNSFKLMNQGESSCRGCTYNLPWRRWGSRWTSGDLARSRGQSTHPGALTLSLVMLVQTMLCDTLVGDLECVWQWWYWEISPTLVLVPGAVFKQDGGNKIMALSLLRTQEALKFISNKFTLTMRLTLAIIGRPPGRALFNVKSRTLRVLTMAFYWSELNIVTMATPPLFF